MKSPKVSVIIPNYNHDQFLNQRIQSVLNQTYSDFEVIILDDCSTDDSRLIIENYRDHPLVKQVVYNSSNTGSPFKQWKKGIDLATGEWIWIAESDDFADFNFLEVMLNTFPDSSDLGLLYCDSKIVSKDGVIISTFSSERSIKLNSNNWERNYINSGLSELENFVLPYGAIHNTSAVLFKREILERVEPFDIPLRFMGDKYAFIKVLAVSSVGYVNNALNFYRAAVGSKPKHTNNYLDYFYEHFLIFNWVKRSIKTIDKRKFGLAISVNAQVSIFKDWSLKKARIFVNVFLLNPTLFMLTISINFSRSLKKLTSL